ncbi:MAG: hypothetical protein QM781_00155 [Chitinophagaceae bacterium]
MIKFNKSSSPVDFTNIEFGIRIKHAQYYSLINDSLTVGSFYFDRKQSAMNLEDSRIFILLKESNFREEYEIWNLNNGALVGALSIEGKTVRKSLKATTGIIHQDPYEWKVLCKSAGTSSFSGRVWSKFSGRLDNGREEAAFIWDYEGNDVRDPGKLYLPVSGEVKMTNPRNHILLAAGLFLIEMEFQPSDND